jgi:hypothetical protein
MTSSGFAAPGTERMEWFRIACELGVMRHIRLSVFAWTAELEEVTASNYNWFPHVVSMLSPAHGQSNDI